MTQLRVKDFISTTLMVLLLPLSALAQPETEFSVIFQKMKEFPLTRKKGVIAFFNEPIVDTKFNIILPTSSGGEVIVFDQTGKEIGVIGSKGEGPGEYLVPIGVAKDASGNIYITDNQLRRLNIYDKHYKFLKSYYIGIDHFIPRRLRVVGNSIFMAALQYQPPNPYLYKCICQYTINGKFVRSFYPTHNVLLERKVAVPSYSKIDLSNDARIYAVQNRYYQIDVFDTTGKLLESFGTKPAAFKDLPGFPSDEAAIAFMKNPDEKTKQDYSESGSDIHNLLVQGDYVFLSFQNVEKQGNQKKTVYYLDIYERKSKRLIASLRTDYRLLCYDDAGQFYFLTRAEETEDRSLYWIGVFKFMKK